MGSWRIAERNKTMIPEKLTWDYEKNVSTMTEAEKNGYDLAVTFANMILSKLNEYCEKEYPDQERRREMWLGYFFKREGWIMFRKNDCPYKESDARA
jgi:hypothetical protein